jgi:hypothetical protein
MDAREIYQAGPGLPVGKIQSIWGISAVRHSNAPDSYLARVGLPLFSGDTVVTAENGSLGCRLNDGSIIKLAADSKLTIHYSAHYTNRKSSISSLTLVKGSAFVKIAKLDEFDPREFKVRTGAVAAKGRQAEFFIESGEWISEIVALADAALEVMSLKDPEQKIFLSEFQRAVIREGVLPATVEFISQEEAARLVSKFQQVPASGFSDTALKKPGVRKTGHDEDIREEDIEDDRLGDR